MKQSMDPSRRALLRRVAFGLTLAPIVAARAMAEDKAASAPFVLESDPAARALMYVDDAAHGKDVPSGANCSNCSLYTSGGPDAGTCTLFPGKRVKAAGWCASWSTL